MHGSRRGAVGHQDDHPAAERRRARTVPAEASDGDLMWTRAHDDRHESMKTPFDKLRAGACGEPCRTMISCVHGRPNRAPSVAAFAIAFGVIAGIDVEQT